nr:venom allergen 5-like [Onthophagus taurus]
MLLYLFLLIPPIFADYYPQDYCRPDLSCAFNNKTIIPHTICEYKCMISDSCEEFASLKFSNIDRYYILAWHNSYRHSYAIGKVNNITVTNMMALSYDEELEYIALCWAKRCAGENDLCRKSLKLGNLGQNIFETIDNTEEVDPKTLMQMAVNYWFEEHNDLKGGVKTVYDKKMIAKSFTQIIWAKTTHIGCAAVRYKDSVGIVFTLVCNYGPAGNLNGEHIYVEGEPGSKCPNGFRQNRVLTGLCGTSSLNVQSREYNPFKTYNETGKFRSNSMKYCGSFKFVFLIVLFLLFD